MNAHEDAGIGNMEQLRFFGHQAVNLHFGRQIIRVLRVWVGSISGEWQHSRQAAGLQPRGDTLSLQRSAAAETQNYLSSPARLLPLHTPTERNQTDNTHQANTHYGKSCALTWGLGCINIHRNADTHKSTHNTSRWRQRPGAAVTTVNSSSLLTRKRHIWKNSFSTKQTGKSSEQPENTGSRYHLKVWKSCFAAGDRSRMEMSVWYLSSH